MATKSKAKHWWESLDELDVREAMDEATVDSCDLYEQHTGLLTMIEQDVQFPFRARVLGEELDIVGMEWPEGDEFGLDLVCERNGDRHRIEARSVELIGSLPEGHLYIAAYLAWKRMT